MPSTSCLGRHLCGSNEQLSIHISCNISNEFCMILTLPDIWIKSKMYEFNFIVQRLNSKADLRLDFTELPKFRLKGKYLLNSPFL